LIRKLSNKELKELTALRFDRISRDERDEMAIPSYRHWNLFIRWLMWRRYECIAKLAGFARDCRVLEFGCGIGVFLPELDRSCGTIYAIDLFPEYARQLSKSLGLKVRFIGSLSEIADSGLDAVVAADVFEHLDVPELDSVLAILHKKLADGGRLIISGPTENTAYRIGRILAGFFGKGAYHHRNIRDIQDRIENLGFIPGRIRRLPFAGVPALFHVVEFTK